MDRQRFALLEALKTAALEKGEVRLYRRGKLIGLFEHRTRANAELANQAIANGLLEMTRVEPAGKTNVEWVRITQLGIDFLLESESPARAMDELREQLAINQNGMPAWLAQINARVDALASQLVAEVADIRKRLEQTAQHVSDSIHRAETARQAPTPHVVPWARETLAYLDRRKQVGLGERC